MLPAAGAWERTIGDIVSAQDPVSADEFAPADDLPLIPAIGEDGSLYPVGKLDAHRRGLRHMAVSVFVFSGDRLLIQQRAAGKYHSGGLWANTCCTHPDWGESVADCAARRLPEELGFSTPVTLCAVVDYHADVGNGLVENERVHVFRGSLAAPSPVTGFAPAEVQAARWVTGEDLRAEVARTPELFTPWLRIYLERWDELALAA